MTPDTRKKLVKWGVAAARVIIGAVFIISGLSKGIDLWGTVFKIEDYLHVWGMHQPRTIVFMGALLLSGTEFLLGALLLLGCCRRWTPIFLTAVMAVMLPLSLYIYIANPVSDCGCFGDFWVISNAATFWKNVVITAGVIFLVCFNRRLAPWFTPYVQWLVIALLTAYLLIIGLYGYNIQPMVDFRSFPVGASLLPDDNDEASDSDDSDAITFVYEKNGERREFTIDSLPDSTWTFVDSNVDTSGIDTATELVVYDRDGNEATDIAISDEGEEMILVIPQLNRAEVAWTYFLNELSDYMASRGGMMVALVAGDDASVDAWDDLSMASYPIYTAESTTLKELARGNMSLVYARDGRVVWKRNMALIDTSMTDSISFDNDDPATFANHGREWFRNLTVLLLAALALLYALDSTGRLVKWRINRRKAAARSRTDKGADKDDDKPESQP
ncbi:MAG: DoxX family membrane protein [Paramuribaculum sp.]|nr:DoxX family membrane protein [Paramuribaculum sp.]